MKRSMVLVSLIAAALFAACGDSEPASQPEDRPTLASWSFEEIEHLVVSGIAGAQPNYWLDRGWDGAATLVYLADREIGCDDFPFVDNPNRFPPLPIEGGAIILLRVTTDAKDDEIHYASFDVLEINSPSGAGAATGDATGGLAIVGVGGQQRVQGWVDYESAGQGSRPLSVSAQGAFDVPFCS